MKSLLLVALSLAMMSTSWTAGCAEGLQFGATAKLPASLGTQLTFAEGFAIEAGIAVTGPGVFAAKVYLEPWDLGGLSLVSILGLGGAVAFLPGDLTAWGAYALAGLELPIPKTSFHVMADLVVILPLPPGAGTLHIGPQLGIRLDFWPIAEGPAVPAYRRSLTSA